MKLAETYTKNQIDKLGNALIFLCNNMEALTKTHVLKLVFIIEEISIQRFGIPFFDLKFQVWHLGPVAKDLYVELDENPVLLSEFIYKENMVDGKSLIKPKKDFCDDEFSDVEIDLLQEVADRFKYCTANELINHTHKKNSLWYITASENGIAELLENKKIMTTEIEIDLTKIISDDEYKMSLFQTHKEFLKESRLLKL